MITITLLSIRKNIPKRMRSAHSIILSPKPTARAMGTIFFIYSGSNLIVDVYELPELE